MTDDCIHKYEALEAWKVVVCTNCGNHMAGPEVVSIYESNSIEGHGRQRRVSQT